MAQWRQGDKMTAAMFENIRNNYEQRLFSNVSYDAKHTRTHTHTHTLRGPHLSCMGQRAAVIISAALFHFIFCPLSNPIKVHAPGNKRASW